MTSTITFAYADSEEPFSLERAGGAKELSVTCYKQEENNSCGPASCRMVLKYFGVSKAESSLRTEMHNMANNDYTHIDSVTSVLNKYISGKPYKKVFNSSEPFATNLTTDIDAGYPIICQVNTKKLPKYNNAEFYHYVVVTGYRWGQGSTGGQTIVYYNDPHYNSKYYGAAECSWSEMSDAINAHSGLYVRGR